MMKIYFETNSRNGTSSHAELVATLNFEPTTEAFWDAMLLEASALGYDSVTESIEDDPVINEVQEIHSPMFENFQGSDHMNVDGLTDLILELVNDKYKIKQLKEDIYGMWDEDDCDACAPEGECSCEETK